MNSGGGGSILEGSAEKQHSPSSPK